MKQVSITNAVKIKNQRVKPFDGEKKYLATGGLIEDRIKTEVITYKSKPTRADLLLTENQLIVARMKGTNKVLLIDKNTSNLIVSTGFLVLEVQKGWHPKFLFHYLASSFFQKQKDKLSIGATQKAINNEKFKKILIPEISYEEQKRIVKILDEADSLRKKRKQAVNLLDYYLKSIFFEMFGDPVKNEKKLNIKKFIDVAKNNNSKRVPVKQEDRDKRGGNYPYYGATGIIDTIDDYKFDGEFLLIAEDGKNLLFRRKNNAFMARGKFWVNNHAHVLSDNGICNLRYLEFFLNNIDFKPYISGIDQVKLNKENLDNIPVPIPAVEHQNKFVNIVQKTEFLKQKMLLQSVEMEKQFQALMQKNFNQSQ